jgi:hypothetical protein
MRLVLLVTLLAAAASVYYLGRSSANTAPYEPVVAKSIGQ